MKIKLSEEVLTSIGPQGPGEVALPKEEALSLIRQGKATVIPPSTRFLANGRGVVDRMIKRMVAR